MQPPSPTPNHHQLTPSPPFNQDNNANANANINTDMDLNKLLIDTFNKVGRASGAGGLESSKWAVNGGESESWYRTRARLNQARQEQQLLQQTQGQRQRQTTIIRNGARTIGAGQGRRILQQQQQQQQQSHLGECRVPSSSNKGMNGNNGVVSTTTAGSTPTKVLRVKDVGMAVDMSSLHSVMRQCIDPGLERIVDVWVVGEASRTITLHFTSTNKATLFSSLLGRLRSWSGYRIEYADDGIEPQAFGGNGYQLEQNGRRTYDDTLIDGGF